ncbi:MAG: IS5 family transposase [Acidiphilium sp.]
MAPKRYELSEKQWVRIGPLIAGKASDPGRTGVDNRLFVNAVLWVIRSGAHWHDLPERYGKYKTVHKRFTRWAKAGVWERIFEDLTSDPDNQYLMLDSTVVRAHQQAANGKGGPKNQALGRSRGGLTTKIHTLTDAEGRPLRFILTGGEAHDVTAAADLLEGQTASGVIADKAYDSNALREMIEEADIEAVIPSKRNRKIQIPHDAQAYKLRNRIERFFNKLKHFRRIATRYDRRAAYFLATIQLASSMIWMR